jgi:hypothetical protein
VADNVKKLPGDVSHLERLIGDHAADRKMPPARLQRWLNAMIVTAVLDRVRDEDGEPIFLLKGGVAMELRLQLRARATGDYDAAFRTRAEEVIDRLDEALSQPWNSFNLTRDAPEIIKNTKAVRVRLRLSYKRRSWGSVYLEMAPVEGKMGRELDRVEAMSLDPLQVPLPEVAIASHCATRSLKSSTPVPRYSMKGARTTGSATSWTSSWSKICCTTSALPAFAKPAWTSSRCVTSTPGPRP